jgi:hypothetical protein
MRGGKRENFLGCIPIGVSPELLLESGGLPPKDTLGGRLGNALPVSPGAGNATLREALHSAQMSCILLEAI